MAVTGMTATDAAALVTAKRNKDVEVNREGTNLEQLYGEISNRSNNGDRDTYFNESLSSEDVIALENRGYTVEVQGYIIRW